MGRHLVIVILLLCRIPSIAADCPNQKSSNSIENEKVLYNSRIHWYSDYASILGATQYIWSVENRGRGVQRYLWEGPGMHNDRLAEGGTDRVCLTLGQPLKDNGLLHYGRGNDRVDTSYWTATRRASDQSLVATLLFSVAKTPTDDPVVQVQVASSAEPHGKRNRFRFEIQNTSQETSPGILLTIGPAHEDLIHQLERVPGLKFLAFSDMVLNPSETAKDKLQQYNPLNRLPFGFGRAQELSQDQIDKAIDSLKTGLKPGHRLVVSFEAAPKITLKQTEVSFLLDEESVAGASVPMFVPEQVSGIDLPVSDKP